MPALPALATLIVRWHPLLLALALALLAGCASLPPSANVPFELSPPPAEHTPLGRVAAPFTRNDQGLSGARVLQQAEFALDARIALIRRAQVSLDLQYYLLGRDKTGLLILRELRDAARRGVRVRLLLDDFYTAGLDPALLGLAAEPNAQVRLFNPFTMGRDHMPTRWLNFATDFRRLNHRMHNKLFVADGVLAVAGGRNLADEYFLRSDGANFIDMDMLLAGPVVSELEAIFDNYWNSELVFPVARVAHSPDTPQALRERFESLTAPPKVPPPPPVPEADMFGDPPVSTALARGRLALSPAQANAVADSPGKALAPEYDAGLPQRRPPTVAERMRQVFDLARSEINIISPYVLPGEDGMEHIARLRARGVGISIMTNSLADTDEPLVNINYNAYRVEMLRLGVRIKEVSSDQIRRSLNLRKIFRQSRGALHAELALIDRHWALVGSLNFDPRSAEINTELGVRIESYEIAQRLLYAFAIDDPDSVYEVRLKEGTDRIQWVSTSGDGVVLEDEPNANPLVRLKLMLFSWFVPSDLL